MVKSGDAKLKVGEEQWHKVVFWWWYDVMGDKWWCKNNRRAGEVMYDN